MISKISIVLLFVFTVEIFAQTNLTPKNYGKLNEFLHWEFLRIKHQ